jgi:D-3-phosphoglycerate dehydrogenase / 2-oxoglutarate reductase
VAAAVASPAVRGARPKILVADLLAEVGLNRLRQIGEVETAAKLHEAELVKAVVGVDALIVRSETRVTRAVLNAGTRLKVVGRAGVGVDNIDVAAASERGIVVVNAPKGNVVAVAEHTLGLILAIARWIPQSAASVRAGEWQRSRFVGTELRGKTLGIIGLGNIGREVARRAHGLEMKVIAFDPAIPDSKASEVGVDLVTFDDLLTTADFVTVHVPLVSATRNLIGARELDLMKPTARLVNAARGGIVDEVALRASLLNGRLAAAAADVFEIEPPGTNSLLELPNFVATPHIAASTHEAQLSVAEDVADQVAAVLRGELPLAAVNAPSVPQEMLEALRPYEVLAGLLASLHMQLHHARPSEVELTVSGSLAGTDTSLLLAAVLRGLLAPYTSERINYVNSRQVAASRGIRIVERREGRVGPVGLALRVGDREIAGSVGAKGALVTRIDSFDVVFPASGRLVLTRHSDRPGIVGRIGTLLGERDVNIAAMQLGRDNPRGAAVMILTVDDAVGADTLDLLRSIDGMEEVLYADLGPEQEPEARSGI